jgi:hypothetical protein
MKLLLLLVLCVHYFAFRFIHSKNRAGLGFQLGVNHLADRTDLELKALRGKQYSGGYNGGAPFPYTSLHRMAKNLPSDLDWRLYGAVTPVKGITQSEKHLW